MLVASMCAHIHAIPCPSLPAVTKRSDARRYEVMQGEAGAVREGGDGWRVRRHSYLCTRAHTRTHARTHARSLARSRSRTRTRTQANTQAPIHARTHGVQALNAHKALALTERKKRTH